MARNIQHYLLVSTVLLCSGLSAVCSIHEQRDAFLLTLDKQLAWLCFEFFAAGAQASASHAAALS